MKRPMFKLLWIGLAGCGFVWRGTEHQFYRDLDGSMGKRLTHMTMPWGDADGTECHQKWSYRGWRGALRYFLRHREWWA